MTATLQVKDLRVYYRTPRGIVKAVDDVTFDVMAGERYGLIGESGSGKSTIAYAIMRMIRVPGRIESGEIWLDGENLLELSDDEMRTRRLARVAMVMQGAMNSLNPVIRIRSQFADGLNSHGAAASKEEARARLIDLLARVGLQPGVADMYPHELSGGMKQRVCIALAMSLRPSLIIADEPTSALDVVVQRQVMQTLRHVQEELNTAVILIGHDMGLMAQFAGRVGVMYAGKIVEEGEVRQIFRRPAHSYTRLLMDSLPTLDEGTDGDGAVSIQPGAVAASGGASMTTSATSLLEATNITKVFSGGFIKRTETVALRNFSFTIDTSRPSITGVVGESGSGKSTMARLLLGLESPTDGSVRYRGKDLRQLSNTERRSFRRDVQAVFQDPFESFNSFYHIDHMLEIPIQKFNLAGTRAEARRIMVDALRAVGLRPEETLGRFPHQLSGGQRQRVMVARALLLNPKLIIADEPVSMIDASLRATVLANLRQLRDEFGISLVYITHDLTTAYQICDDLVVLYRGYVAEAGDARMVVKNPKHPYTQLLVGSIPRPDPDRLWQDEAPPSPLAAKARRDRGCPFAARCPHTFEPCLEEAPPLYRMDPARAATCYLYRDAPVVPFDEMAELLLLTSGVPRKAAPAPVVPA